MKRKRKSIFVLILAFIMVFGLAACGSGTENSSGQADGASVKNEPTVIKFAHVQPTGSYFDLSIQEFKKEVEEKTDGAVIVEIYPASQLGSDAEVTESISNGIVEMSIISGGTLSSFCDDAPTDIFSLPFLFGNSEEFYDVLSSELATEIMDSTKEYNIEAIAAFDSGFRQLSNSVRPIESLEDVKGLKIRCPESDIWVNTMKAIGAAPTPMALSEVFTALQTGVIDGQENPIVAFDIYGFAEVQKYFTITNYMNDPIFVVSSKSLLESLSDEHEQIVREAALNAADWERNYLAENEEETLERMQEEWGIEVTYPDLAPFRDAVESVHANYKDQELLNELKALIDSIR